MRRTPSRTPIRAVRRSTSQIQPCRGLRQGAPHRSASPPAVLATRRRTLSIPFALIPVHGRVRIADDPAAQQRHYLVDPIRDLALDSKSKLRLDLLETDPVVTRVLVLVDEVDTRGRDAFPEKVHDVALPIVLLRIADVEHLAGDGLDRTLEDEQHGSGGVAYVGVRTPKLFPVYDQIITEADVPRELVDRQVEPHPRRCAVDGGEAQATCCGWPVRMSQ